MPSRRGEIQMSDDELRSFLVEQRTMQCVTIGPNGRPHLMPLWYVADGLELLGWTFAKSQKAKNLERDPRATVGVDDGEQYQELRGVMFECDVELTRDTDAVLDIGLGLYARFGAEGPEVKEMVLAQAKKRVGLRFVPTKIVSWDHRKLGGVY